MRCKIGFLGERYGGRCGPPGRGCKSVMEELAAWKKGVAADVAPLEEDAKV
jgi:hypothetical protein